MDAVKIAKGMVRRRQAIYQHFDQDLFADPARDILLDLFIAHAEGRQISVGSCCIASEVPMTTALRWIKAMRKRGLLDEIPCDQDGRRVLVSLSTGAVEAMRAYLTELASNELA